MELYKTLKKVAKIGILVSLPYTCERCVYSTKPVSAIEIKEQKENKNFDKIDRTIEVNLETLLKKE